MCLAAMVSLDEDALICDMAETYHIYDMYSMDPAYIAILACGLRGNSRIKCRYAGFTESLDDYMLSLIVDKLSTLIWFQTEDGHKGLNRPASLAEMLIAREPKENGNMTFRTQEEFEAARAEIIAQAEVI